MKGSISLISFVALSAVSALDQPSWAENALGSSGSSNVPDNWTAGRAWPRTECDSSISGPQACASGGCSGESYVVYFICESSRVNSAQFVRRPLRSRTWSLPHFNARSQTLF
ncbi:hypothetical protein B0H19DRAFT_518847 [Mycena capillaripes]|nr:hypothetical protein B0H19DRAFT_518847 [Mycena capillaripes]